VLVEIPASARVSLFDFFPSLGRSSLRAPWVLSIPAYFTDSNASPGTRIFRPVAAPSISNPGPDVVNDSLTVQHHFDRGSDSETFNDPGEWAKASYNHHQCDDFEPLPDAPNDYRAAALYHLQLMYAVDDFITAATDSRLAVVAVAVALGWPSARGLSVGNVADQLGCSLSTLTRSIARFKTLAGLNSLRPGADH
jgi:hypothetical protein